MARTGTSSGGPEPGSSAFRHADDRRPQPARPRLRRWRTADRRPLAGIRSAAGPPATPSPQQAPAAASDQQDQRRRRARASASSCTPRTSGRTRRDRPDRAPAVTAPRLRPTAITAGRQARRRPGMACGQARPRLAGGAQWPGRPRSSGPDRLSSCARAWPTSTSKAAADHGRRRMASAMTCGTDGLLDLSLEQREVPDAEGQAWQLRVASRRALAAAIDAPARPGCAGAPGSRLPRARRRKPTQANS